MSESTKTPIGAFVVLGLIMAVGSVVGGWLMAELARGLHVTPWALLAPYLLMLVFVWAVVLLGVYAGIRREHAERYLKKRKERLGR
jgi:hypothetical protein